MSNRLAGGIKAGSTSVSLVVQLLNLTTREVQTGINATDVTSVYYVRQGDTPQLVSLSQLGSDVASYSAGGWFPYSSSGTPGLYRLDLPDAAFANGADWVAVSVVVNPTCAVTNFMLALEEKGASDLHDITAADVWAYVTRALTDKAGFSISGTTQTFDALQTALSGAHGAGSWATATGFSVPGSAMTLTSAYDAAKSAASATALAAVQTHGDSTWATATGFSVPGSAMTLTGAYDAAKTAASATALAAVQTHGDATWATATGFSVPGSAMTLTGAYDAAKTAASATALAAVQTHGDSAWHTATGFAVAGDIPSASTIATTVNTTLTGAHGAGSWQEGTGGGGGGTGLSGPSAVVLAFIDADANPVPLVDFTIVGQGVARALTDGTASFGLDDGDYTVIARPTAGILFAAAALVVSGATALTISGTALVLPTPAAPDQVTGYIYTRNGQGALQPAVTLTFELLQTTGDDSHRTAAFTATSDSNSLLTVALRQFTKYRARRGTGLWYEFTTGTVTPYELPSILGT